jgi:hypothetical protein
MDVFGPVAARLRLDNLATELLAAQRRVARSGVSVA